MSGHSLSLESYVSRILLGDALGAGIDPPVLQPIAHRRLRAEARRRYATPDFGCPVDAMRAEGFLVCQVPNAPPCGIETDRRVILPHHQDRLVEALLAQHGRGHAWARRVWLADATEADVWHATAEFVFPRALRHDAGAALLARAWAPHWFVGVVLRMPDVAIHAA